MVTKQTGNGYSCGACARHIFISIQLMYVSTEQKFVILATLEYRRRLPAVLNTISMSALSVFTRTRVEIILAVYRLSEISIMSKIM
jgi:hypothetical protein